LVAEFPTLIGTPAETTSLANSTTKGKVGLKKNGVVRLKGSHELAPGVITVKDGLTKTEVRPVINGLVLPA
jgi:hypothetical protein